MSILEIVLAFALVAFVGLLSIGYVARRRSYVAARAQIMLWPVGMALVLIVTALGVVLFRSF